MASCGWCGLELEATKPASGGRPAVYCSKNHRQQAFRLRSMSAVKAPGASDGFVFGDVGAFRRRRRRGLSSPVDDARLEQRRIRVAYADPPYPGKAKRYYQHEPTYRGEVDHAALIASLLQDYPDGWALSTSEEALRDVLPLCPKGAHLCPWVKPTGVSRRTRGLHSTWEALIVVGGRRRSPGMRDWLYAASAKGGGTLMGRKPLRFCAFLFDALGLLPGDELVDLFPGTGIVGRAWANLSGSSATIRRPRRAQVLGDVSSRRAAGEDLHDETSPGPGAPAPGDETATLPP